MSIKNVNIQLSFLQHTVVRRTLCAVVGMAALAVMLLGIYSPTATKASVNTSVHTSTRISTAALPVVHTNSTQVSRLSAHLSAEAVGSWNDFPYGQCTYWADERYHQLHGVYVPWMVNANASVWSSDALSYNWHVSSTPTVGSIIQLDPGVQGADGYGHVGIVEQILSNGQVSVSNMNWNGMGSQVSYWNFTPGAGVHFITY